MSVFDSLKFKAKASAGGAPTMVEMTIEDAQAMQAQQEALHVAQVQCAALFGKTGTESDFSLFATVKALQDEHKQSASTIADLQAKLDAATAKITELGGERAEEAAGAKAQQAAADNFADPNKDAPKVHEFTAMAKANAAKIPPIINI